VKFTFRVDVGCRVTPGSGSVGGMPWVHRLGTNAGVTRTRRRLRDA
jgi:hypothetical protein